MTTVKATQAEGRSYDYPKSSEEHAGCADEFIEIAPKGVAVGGVAALLAAPLLGLACGGGRASSEQIHKIKHVVVIMQENHSFDNYFGAHPGADGIPGLAGHPGPVPCIPDRTGGCVKPYHYSRDIGVGGPHSGVTPPQTTLTSLSLLCARPPFNARV